MIKDVAGRVISGIVSALAIWTFNEFATPSMKAHLWSFITNFFPIGVGLVAALIWWIITTIRRAGTLAEKVTRLEATIRATGASGDNEIVYRDPAARRGWGFSELINMPLTERRHFLRDHPDAWANLTNEIHARWGADFDTDPLSILALRVDMLTGRLNRLRIL